VAEQEGDPHCKYNISISLLLTDEKALDKVLGTPREMTLVDIDAVVVAWVHGAVTTKEAGFAGCQLHGAHRFLLSQFLSPHTNRRTDDYGGTPEKRLTLLKRLVKEIRERCPRPYCLSVKLNSADYMAQGGLSQDEGLEQVRWLVECGQVDFVEISGGNAENKTSGLHSKKFSSNHPDTAHSFRFRFLWRKVDRQGSAESRINTDKRSLLHRIRRKGAAFRFKGSGSAEWWLVFRSAFSSSRKLTRFVGFRSRTGMADAIESGVCSMIGLGRSAVLQPDIPSVVLLNSSVPDDAAFAQSHIVKGQWLAQMIPVKVVGAGLAIQFFYHNMRRLGNGLKSDPDVSLPYIVFQDILETVRSGLVRTMERLLADFPWGSKSSKMD